MLIVVVNKDGNKNVFPNQKDDPELVNTVSLAVASGNGFTLAGPKDLFVYGPGSVARVAFTNDPEQA